MKATTYRSARRPKRWGTTAVEVAVTLPIFFTFVFGLIEYARIQLVTNLLNTACHHGARYGATEGVSTSEVLSRVDQMMSAAIDTSGLDTLVKDAGVFDTGGPFPGNPSEYSSLPDMELGGAEARQLFLIRASVDYNDIAIIPFSVLDGYTLTGQAFMRHE